MMIEIHASGFWVDDEKKPAPHDDGMLGVPFAAKPVLITRGSDMPSYPNGHMLVVYKLALVVIIKTLFHFARRIRPSAQLRWAIAVLLRSSMPHLHGQNCLASGTQLVMTSVPSLHVLVTSSLAVTWYQAMTHS